MNITREQVIAWAREAGFEVNFDIRAVSVEGVHINKELERFAAFAYAAGAAAQRQWVGLTKEQRDELAALYNSFGGVVATEQLLREINGS